MKRGLFACLLLIAAEYSQAADGELGRLFFSPAERDAMDRARSGEPMGPIGATGTTINGYVVRSDGKNTVWVNGQPRATGPKTANEVKPSLVGETESVILRPSKPSEKMSTRKIP